MKKIPLVLFLGLALTLSFFSVGLASTSLQATATPTNTSYPTFYPTGTDLAYGFPSDFTCPTGLPSGYGTLTPDDFWSFSCGQCLATPLSTSTSLPAPTVTGTVPPTVTPTGTPAPAGLLSCGSMPSHLGCEVVDTNTVKLSILPVWSDSLPSSIFTGARVVRSGVGVGAPIYMYALHSGTNQWVNNSNNFGTNPPYPNAVSWSITNVQLGYIYATNLTYEVFTSPNYTVVQIYFDEFHNTETSSSSGDLVVGYNHSIAPNSYTHYGYTGGSYLMISTVPIDLTPPSYCEEISGTSPGGDPSDFEPDPAVMWGGVSYGYNACVDIGGWSLSWLGVDYEFPLVRFCMQDVSFANMVVFGVSVSIDSILYVLVAAWAVRRMITS